MKLLLCNACRTSWIFAYMATFEWFLHLWLLSAALSLRCLRAGLISVECRSVSEPGKRQCREMLTFTRNQKTSRGCFSFCGGYHGIEWRLANDCGHLRIVLRGKATRSSTERIIQFPVLIKQPHCAKSYSHLAGYAACFQNSQSMLSCQQLHFST